MYYLMQGCNYIPYSDVMPSCHARIDTKMFRWFDDDDDGDTLFLL